MVGLGGVGGTPQNGILTNKKKYMPPEGCVRLFRNWEFTVKNMVDYRNHQRFTFRSIKADITPVSCEIRNPSNPVEVIGSFTKL